MCGLYEFLVAVFSISQSTVRPSQVFSSKSLIKTILHFPKLGYCLALFVHLSIAKDSSGAFAWAC